MTTTTDPKTEAPYKLRRARKGRMLGGVAAGLATASGLDVTIVRIAIGLSMLSGLGIVGYLLLWIVIPEEAPLRGRPVEEAPENTARMIRVSLAVAGLLGVLKQMGGFWPFDRGHSNGFGVDGILAIALITIGLSVLFSRHRPESGAWPVEPPTPTEPAAPAGDDDTADAPVVTDDERPTFVGPFREIVGTVHNETVKAIKDRSERRKGSAALGWSRALGWFVVLWWLAALIGYTVLWQFNAFDVSKPVVTYVLAWICFVGVINTLIRVRQPTAVVASLLLLGIPVVSGAVSARAEGPVGSRIVRPVYTDLDRSYEHALGKFTLDFGATDFPTNKTTDVDVKIGIGELDLTVPNDVSLVIDTSLDAGGYSVLNRETDGGLGQKERLRFDGCPGAAKLHLKVTGGAGYLEVHRESGLTEPTCPAPAA